MPRPKKNASRAAPPPPDPPDIEEDLDDEPEEPAVPEGQKPLAQVKAMGALTTDADNKNKKNDRIKKRKLRGDKHVPWDEEGPVLYALLVETFGSERVRVHVVRTQPSTSDCGIVPLSSVPDYETLRQMIVDNHWDGKKATFRWTAMLNGTRRMGADTICFDDDPVQQKKWAAKAAPTPQEGSVAGGQQPIIMQAPAVQQQTMSPQHMDYLFNRLVQLENKIDSGATRSRPDHDDPDDRDEPDDPDDRDNEEPDDPPEPQHFAPRIRSGVPPPPRMHQPQPTYESQEPEPNMSADQDEYEQVRTSSGTAWVKKPKNPMPPPGLPDPPPGYAYQCTATGVWMQVPVSVQAAPLAPPVAAAPVVQQPVFPQRDFELLEEKHKIEVQLAQLQERYKLMGEVGKVRAEVAAAMSNAPVAPSGPMQQQPSSMPPGNVQLPPGWGWQQGPGGSWQPVQIQQAAAAPTVGAVAAAPATVADQVRSMADTIKSLNTLQSSVRSILPSPKDDAAAAIGAVAEGAGADDSVPLTKLDAGSWQMWFNKDDKKPVDTATQIALNLGNIQSAGKDLIKTAMDGYKEILDKQQNDKSAKLEKDRAEMASYIRRQQQQINDLEDRMSVRSSRRVVYEDVPEPDEGPVAGPPTPEPTEPDPPPPAPTTSLTSGALAAFGRKL
jgi:hypothetical protein